MQKRKSLAALILAVVMTVACAVPALAAETRASEYLNSYMANTYTSGNDVILDVFIQAPFGASITKIGVEKVVIQESPNGYSAWSPVDTLYSWENPDFTKSGTTYSEHYSVYTGTPGMWYRCVVTIYAGNSSGTDSRTITSGKVQV